MADAATQEEPKGTIESEEWIKVMRQVLRTIELQLAHLERRARRGTSEEQLKGTAKPWFDPSDIRALKALTNALGQLKIMNGQVKAEDLSEEARRELAKGRALQDDIERRLARLAKQGEDQ